MNVSVPYKKVTSTQFSELLLYLLFLENNQLSIIHMPKKHILGGKFCFPSAENETKLCHYGAFRNEGKQKINAFLKIGNYKIFDMVIDDIESSKTGQREGRVSSGAI